MAGALQFQGVRTAFIHTLGLITEVSVLNSFPLPPVASICKASGN